MSKREEIIDAAEAMIRDNGYNGFSTRDIAALVGIKSASVHYHFPTKADIGAAVTERYTDRFLEALADPKTAASSQSAVVDHFAQLFHHALNTDGKLCLCAVLGAEISGLPSEVGRHTSEFFDRNLTWLQEALMASGGNSAVEARNQALHILSAFEGALILSKNLDDNSVFDRVVEKVRQTV